MKASINSWLAWLFAERYESRPPRGVTRRWLSGGVPPGGDRSPEGATGTGWGVSGDQAKLPGPCGGLGAVGGAELAQEWVTCFLTVSSAPPPGRGRCHGWTGPRRAAAAPPARPGRPPSFATGQVSSRHWAIAGSPARPPAAPRPARSSRSATATGTGWPPCRPPEPAAADLGHPSQRPALIRTQLWAADPASSTASSPRSCARSLQRTPTAYRQRPPPPGLTDIPTPGNAGRPPGHPPRSAQPPPAPATPAGPAPRGQPRRHPDTSFIRLARETPRRQRRP